MKNNERRLIEEGKDVISLAIGDPDLPTPKPIMDTISKSLKEKYYGYPDSRGMPELRETLADYYDCRFDVGCTSENIAIGMGAKTDLFDLTRVLSNPGDTVAIQDPAYPVYENSTIFEGRRLVYLPCTEDNNFLALPSEFMKPEQLKKVVLCFMSYPNNPTGAVAGLIFLNELVKEAQKYGFAIVYDNAYCDFTPGGKPFAPSIFQVSGAEDVAIEVGSFSKPYSMTGMRANWTLSYGKIKDHWLNFKSNRDSGTSNYIQSGCITALTDEEVQKIVEENMKIYGERAKILVDGFRKMGFGCRDLKSTPYAWVNIKKLGLTSEEYCSRVLNDAYVVLTPGSGFGPSGEGYFRATIFQPAKRLKEAVERMKQISF